MDAWAGARAGLRVGARQGRAGHDRLGSTGAQPGRAAGQRAVHLVHSACF